MKKPLVLGVAAVVALGVAATTYLGRSGDAPPGPAAPPEGPPVASRAPAAPALNGAGAPSDLQGQWQHLDTRIKFTCTGSPEKEKQAQGETFTLEEGAAPGELQYADRSCTLRLGVSGVQASVLPDQTCSGGRKAFHYDSLTVTLVGNDSAKLEGSGVFRLDASDKLVECSFKTTGTAKKIPG